MRARPDERQHLTVLAILLAVVLILAAGILWMSPRHRNFYGAFFRSDDILDASRPVESPKVETRSRGARKVTDQPSTEGPTDQILVRVVDRPPAAAPAGSPLLGWGLKEFTGKAHVEVLNDSNRVAVRLASQQTSFALYRDVVVSLNEFPVLTWSWKAVKLPKGGDVRRAVTDDEAAQLYVIVPHWPFPRVSSDVLGYVWDSHAPVGATLQSQRHQNVRLIVLESGEAKLGRWVTERRNVLEDYRALFGKEPSPVGRVVIMIDSNDTRSEAEALFGDLTFSTRPPDLSKGGPLPFPHSTLAATEGPGSGESRWLAPANMLR